MTYSRAAAVVSTALLASGTKADNYFVAAEAPDYNNQVVGNLLENVNSLRNPGEAYAVFDWDNTCVFGDLTTTTTYYMMDNLNFRFAPEDFEAIFSYGYNSTSGDSCVVNGTSSVIGQDVNGVDVTYATALNETAKDYKVLYDAYIAPTYNLTNSSAVATATLEDIKKTTEFFNFRAKMSFLLYGVGYSDGGNPYSQCALSISMSIEPHLLVGMTEDEIRDIARASIRWNLGQEIEEFTFTSTGDFAVEGWYTKGLRLFNGQESVMRALRAAGIEVYVISASPELYVAEASQFLGLGYLVPNDNVYGVRFKFDDAGLFTAELEDNYPITWGPGKATIIKSILQHINKGAAPIYASGDSDGDCEMFDTVRDGIVYTNNRLQKNSTCIYSFYQKACEYFGTTEPITNNVYLLQGQDQVLGSWITSGFSTKDGITYTSGVAANNDCDVYQFLDLQ
ncbi:hypothetical protein PHYBOEH_000486 [Phytophthora boehmeriae]|uniref:Uncharacterized protein n=1 Tax=Phytophthora boehmeriae TaxID=109152 RepID=A0A8T1VDF6_9STRA|nr:hypothetical protein PHYBOEH_000486 [Phytophthora boehmeriae]